MGGQRTIELRFPNSSSFPCSSATEAAPPCSSPFTYAGKLLYPTCIVTVCMHHTSQVVSLPDRYVEIFVHGSETTLMVSFNSTNYSLFSINYSRSAIACMHSLSTILRSCFDLLRRKENMVEKWEWNPNT